MVEIRDVLNLKLLGQWLQDASIGLLSGVVVAYATGVTIFELWYFVLTSVLFLAAGGIMTVTAEEKEREEQEERERRD